jgi:DNA-binding PadR family transcriptional regulator
MPDIERQVLSLVKTNHHASAGAILRAMPEVLAGRIYVAIERLQAHGYIACSVDHTRRLYTITELGKHILEETEMKP